MRIILLALCIVLTFHLDAQEKADSLKRSSNHLGVGIDFMGIGYHGYAYPEENRAFTLSGEWIGRPNKSDVCKPYLSLGIGATVKHPIGYTTFSAGVLFGRRNSFFRLGGALATAFTEHEVYWHIYGYNGGSSGHVLVTWDTQFIPVVGYTFWSEKIGLITSAYISPHFSLRDHGVPGSVERWVWPSAGVSVGYLF